MTPTSRRTALKVLGGAAASGGAALTSFGGAPAAAASGRIPADLKPGGKLDQLITDLAAKDQFSGSVLLTHRKRPVLSRSHGMADRKRGVRNGPRTRFALASITKMFTAVAVHQLVRQGKLNYTDKLGAHLDGFPAHIADKVTVHHLFTHSSGLGDFHGLHGYSEASEKWNSADEVLNGTVDFIRKVDLNFPPGAGNHYSNSAYCLLGAIVAALSNQSYYTYMKRLFRDARMGDSGFFAKPQWRTDPTLAHPYYKKPGSSEWTDGLEEHAYIALPPGGSFATCADMDRFAQLLMNNDLLGPAHTSLMLGAKIPKPVDEAPEDPSPPGAQLTTTFAGYGSLTELVGDQWVHGHGGGSVLGTSANLDFFPASGWVVVVLANSGDRSSKPIATLARDIILQQ
ncbi:beta-lactamase family protein [Actinomadura madurae]|uniref:serine hydrolase domain-containing protein n=1 Tax=Actinomadura madurae TaxID=1993 RepID=UPI0020271B6B|nr:serine hydrolase domain-containing protein [Actinomadura madurae]URM97609.1 beta-lactamase family protein [Actinomadura madurae]